MRTRKFVAFLSLALAICLAVPATASALSPAVGRKAVRLAGVDVAVTVSVAGRSGACYGPGDLVVVDAVVTNSSGKPVTGAVKLTCPAFEDHELVAVPEFVEDGGYYDVGTLEDGGSVELAVAMRAPEDPECKDWLASALFVESGSRAVASGHASGAFGQPLLKADKGAMKLDGVLKVRNDGTGTAGKVRFWFTAKQACIGKKGLPDGARETGNGRIEIDLGDIPAGGKAEKDVSGLLHQRMDPDGDYGIVHGGGEAPGSCWE